MSLGEFELIGKYFSGHDKSDAVTLGIGDDCALLRVPHGSELAITTDTQIEGIHFFKNTDPFLLGYKSLLVNLSDLASMGAKPIAFTLSLSLPHADENFLKGFSQGLFSLANKHSLPLIGGNTTKGQLSITISAYGCVEQSRAMRRDRALVGDDIYVTGTLGLPGFAVALGYNEIAMDKSVFDECYKKSMLIEDRCAFAYELSRYSKCAIDISDGLVGDLKHILDASNVGAMINLEDIPLPCEFAKYNLNEKVYDLALYGGCDYELLFTSSESFRQNIKELAQKFCTKVTRIGTITKNSNLQILKHGIMCNQNLKPFEHF